PPVALLPADPNPSVRELGAGWSGSTAVEASACAIDGTAASEASRFSVSTDRQMPLSLYVPLGQPGSSQANHEANMRSTKTRIERRTSGMRTSNWQLRSGYCDVPADSFDN